MSDLVMKIDLLTSSLPVRASRSDVTLLKENLSVIKINPPENDTFFDVIAVVDPLTREAQKMTQLLDVLGKIVNVRMKLFMNCRAFTVLFWNQSRSQGLAIVLLKDQWQSSWTSQNHTF